MVFLAFVAFTTQVVSIYLSNTMYLASFEATKLRAQADELSETNMRLQSELLALSSYNAISSRAGELGYKKTPEFISLYDPIEVARTR
ncbi:MAG: hypothetical protein HY427_01430 [Candidatus Levybacteria bacterium]|nr:hypothetical protein [Candidatus Levybacteria bacterium]